MKQIYLMSPCNNYYRWDKTSSHHLRHCFIDIWQSYKIKFHKIWSHTLGEIYLRDWWDMYPPKIVKQTNFMHML